MAGTLAKREPSLRTGIRRVVPFCDEQCLRSCITLLKKTFGTVFPEKISISVSLNVLDFLGVSKQFTAVFTNQSQNRVAKLYKELFYEHQNFTSIALLISNDNI